MANIANAHKKPGGAGGRATTAQIKAHRPEALVTYRVSVLAQVLGKLVDASVRKHLDMTARQWRVLVVLNRLGTSPTGEVARMANFDHSQASRVAFELAEMGLITQQSDASDRRKQILAMTPAGIEKLRQGLPVSLDRQERLIGRLSPEEQAVFGRALEAIEDEANKLLEELKGLS